MHNHHESNQTAGNLKISREVIATIARYAALEIEGIDSLASFTSNINVKAGVNIPEVSEKVQATVKEAVQNMTGIAVSRVNINIAGIIFDEPPLLFSSAEQE